MHEIYRLALPLPKNMLFSYLYESDNIEENHIGKRALVPFGKRVLTGYIVEKETVAEITGLKSIIEILDEKPVFDNNMLNFTKWISNYYFCGWGEVLKAALPLGMSPKSLLKIQVLKLPTEQQIDTLSKTAPKRAALLKYISKSNDSITVDYLERELKSGSIDIQLNRLETDGFIKIEKFIEKEIEPRKIKAISIHPELYNNNDLLKKALDELDKKAPNQSSLLSRLYLAQKETGKPIIISDLLKLQNISYSTLKSLINKGFAHYEDIEIERGLIKSQKHLLTSRDESLLTLTHNQNECINEICSALDENKFEPFLLHGITGSGKTLVYIHAIKKADELGKQSLILVPEISLTPQLIDRFNNVFPDKIAVLHSRMSEGERYDSWRAILDGKRSIVLGVRSAIFAPLKNLGLIIVDEEHEPSYKQDSPAPRYNARDAALVRGKIENAVVVLGSATPSIESMYNAKTGKYKLLTIKERADGAVLPEIKISNIITARKSGKLKGIITQDLINEMNDALMKKEGIILFQNRRGFSSFLECNDCGFIPTCKFCSVSLTYHKSLSQLRCHYCGYIEKVYVNCPACGNKELKEIGFGTQRVEEILDDIFKTLPEKPKYSRMDLDTTSKRGAFRKILHSFSTGETDILLGTQMVAKGLDFERVTLVGVINADLQLFLPDFRASERTFQLLTQVAGRAGRTASKPGKVIIQTSHPDNPVIKAVLLDSYDMFYENEIVQRKEAAYPPFTRFIIIEFAGKNERQVNTAADKFKKILPMKANVITVHGPISPLIFKIRNMYRKLIIIKNNKDTDTSALKLNHILNSALEKYHAAKNHGEVKIIIDIDSYLGL